MRNTRSALVWIVHILEAAGVPFEIDGGLAAKLYGSPRALADIDINVPEKDFHKIVPLVKDYAVFGPGEYKDKQWQLLMMTLTYAGQQIDIGALETMRYFDAGTKEWHQFPADLSTVHYVEHWGLSLPVINKPTLIAYKRQLARGVDKKDVAAMEQQLLE